ncbi:sensor histidine kinase [Oryzihumus leptocrescens]|uniref:Histidine kinase/DNA gyrase B/HSP90-like ATPase n=1 Tax=Oryzihumus leptocrescens TaxID=297536 RepID=A0A542Z9C5_9MICO|nr:GAF domain-containing protein [Oryzihumus leptocrescens]TQL56820.1 histidine kinase/DNA gyrase B/HSP90-like ATPase [Oryzihumus leptocrescens]
MAPRGPDATGSRQPAVAPASDPLTFPSVARLELDQLLEQLVERAQEVMRTQDRMHGLLRALQSIVSDLDLTSLLQRIVDEARTLVGAQYAALGVVGQDRTLVEFVHSGMDAQTVETIGSLPTGRGILGQLISDPQPLRLSRLAGHASSVGFPEGHPPMTSFLGVPVRVGGHVFGNLYLTEKVGGSEFTAEDEELAQSLAAAAAAAINNARLFEGVSRREQWLQASRTITNALLGTLDRTEALQLVARSVRSSAGADFAAVVVPEADGELRIAAADGLEGELMVGRPVPADGSATGTALLSGEPVVLEDLRSATGLAGPIRALGIGPLAAIPLSTGEGVLGVLTVGHLPGSRRFTSEDVALVSDFASQAALVLTVAANQAAARENEMAEERAQIARDLHDHAIQGIFAVGLGLNGMATRATPEEAARLMELVGRLDDSIKAIRNSIFTLQVRHDTPPSLRSLLTLVVMQSGSTLGFTPRLQTSGPVDTVVPAEVGRDLEAVLREALSNVARHAQASHVAVTVTAGRDVVLEVRDDGRGIGTPDRSSGLANMRARAEAHGGTCEVGPGPGSGTLVRWTVPLVRG